MTCAAGIQQERTSCRYRSESSSILHRTLQHVRHVSGGFPNGFRHVIVGNASTFFDDASVVRRVSSGDVFHERKVAARIPGLRREILLRRRVERHDEGLVFSPALIQERFVHRRLAWIQMYPPPPSRRCLRVVFRPHVVGPIHHPAHLPVAQGPQHSIQEDGVLSAASSPGGCDPQGLVVSWEACDGLARPTAVELGAGGVPESFRRVGTDVAEKGKFVVVFVVSISVASLFVVRSFEVDARDAFYGRFCRRRAGVSIVFDGRVFAGGSAEVAFVVEIGEFASKPLEEGLERLRDVDG